MSNKKNQIILEVNTVEDLSFFFLNDKPLIIEIENLSELELLIIIDSIILKNLNKNYLNILSKKMLNDETLKNLDIIMFSNRNLLSRDNIIKLIFKNRLIDYEKFKNPEFDYYNVSYSQRENFDLFITESRKITLNKSIKFVFIYDILSSKFLPKGIINRLLENQKIDVLKIKKMDSQNSISYFYYDKKII